MRDDDRPSTPNPQRGPVDPTRRKFLVNTRTTAAASVIGAYISSDASADAGQSGSTVTGASIPNIEGGGSGGSAHQRQGPSTSYRSSYNAAGLPPRNRGTDRQKKGCDHGQCGACTVHVNGRRVLSCLNFAAMHGGEEITTIEGLGTPDAMHPTQAAFFTHDAYQCDYCRR